MKHLIPAAAALALLIPACTGGDNAPSGEAAPPAAEVFFDNLTALCGNAYEGRLVSDDPRDADFAAAPLVMHVRDCSDDEIAIPLSLGDDRSRTWIITRTGSGLRLKHRHLHEDGSADDMTFYGGDSAAVTPVRAEFPADEESKSMFTEGGIPDSRQNTWAVEVRPDQALFAYELSRPERYFRLEFDTSAPIAPPGTPHWGDAD